MLIGIDSKKKKKKEPEKKIRSSDVQSKQQSLVRNTGIMPLNWFLEHYLEHV